MSRLVIRYASRTFSRVLSTTTTLIRPCFDTRQLQSNLPRFGRLHQLPTWALPCQLYHLPSLMPNRFATATRCLSQSTSASPQRFPPVSQLLLHCHELRRSPATTLLLSMAPTISHRSHAIPYQTRTLRTSWQRWVIYTIPARSQLLK